MKLPRTINTVLFDVDGVLYDSMPLHDKSWKESFKQIGVKVSTTAVYECEGMPDTKAARFIAKEAGTKISPKQVKFVTQRKRALFDTYRKPKFIKGAQTFVKFLQKNGYKIGVVTGSSQPETVRRIKRDFKIEKKYIVTGKDVTHGKPHPEPFLKALKKVGSEGRQAVAIENAPLGIRSARKAKMKCVALLTGPLKKTELVKAGAQIIAKDCRALPKYFEK